MVRDLFETPFSKFRSLFINPENIPKILMTCNLFIFFFYNL